MFAYGKSLFLVIDLQWRIGLIAKVGVYAVFCPPSGGCWRPGFVHGIGVGAWLRKELLAKLAASSQSTFSFGP